MHNYQDYRPVSAKERFRLPVSTAPSVALDCAQLFEKALLQAPSQHRARSAA